MTSKTSLELPEITAAIVVGGIGIAASVYLYKLYHANQKPAIQLFNEGNITKAAIQEICRQIQNGESPQGDNKENALQLACRYGNIQAVNAILPLMRMEELKYVNIHGCNLIHLCGTEKDNSDILQCIITHVLQQRGGETLLQELFSTKTFDNQWTPLHLFCGKGFANCVKILLNTPETVKKIPVNEKDSNGHTALVMASANGHLECVKLLLDQPDINIYLGDSRCKTCLYFAAFNQLEEIVDLILATERAGGEEYIKKNSPEQFKIVDICDYSGNSPLHAACLKGNLSLVKKLLAHGAQINSTSVSGDSCLHLCCQRNDAKHHEILDFLCKQCSDSEFVELMKKTTSFGCSALHDAAYCGNWKAMRYLHNGRKEEFLKCLEGCDNDGLTPMLSLCRGIITYKAKKFNPDDLLKTLEELLELGCNPNGGDFAKSTCLHFLCYGTPNYEPIIAAVKILLKYGADPSCEDTFGWSPLHAIYNAPPSDVTAEIIKLLETYLQEKNPEFLKSFDKKKVRNIKDRTFVEKAGPHNRIPIEERNAVLQGDFTTKGIADYIKRHLENNESMKIVVLVGAGISVNCGIPDFRSPGTGIYSKINPGQFSLEFLATAPQQFYEFVREMFGPVFKGSVKPSDTHLFLKLLSDKGLLKRLYTQNIDTIENLVGLPNELVIPAHGSFESARCATCMKPVEDMRAQFWDPIFDSEIPSCSYCGRVVRPDVVFFGENLPGRFFECHHSDLKDADLLIVMGTSLVVYPFASLVGMVPLLTPRLLINKQLTGPFTKKTSSTYRDAVYLGDCDDGINELSQYLGWSEELNTLKEKRDQTSQE